MNVYDVYDDVEIVTSSSRSEKHLMTLEALLINQLKPELNSIMIRGSLRL